MFLAPFTALNPSLWHLQATIYKPWPLHKLLRIQHTVREAQSVLILLNASSCTARSAASQHSRSCQNACRSANAPARYLSRQWCARCCPATRLWLRSLVAKWQPLQTLVIWLAWKVRASFVQLPHLALSL